MNDRSSIPDPAGHSGARRFWPLLLPAAYLVHLLEELRTASGFTTWAARYLSAAFTPWRFWIINGIGWPAMLAGCLAASLAPGLRWLAATSATILAVNGLLHLLATATTGAWSPGVLTGTFFYLPLGAATLVRLAREMPAARLAPAALLGLLLHGLVVLFVLAS